MIILESQEIKEKYIAILDLSQAFHMWGEGRNLEFYTNMIHKIKELNDYEYGDQKYLDKRLDELDEFLNDRFNTYSGHTQVTILDDLKLFRPYGFNMLRGHLNDGTYKFHCKYCHKPMYAKRTDAGYCTAKCKQAAYRVRKQIQHP